MKSFLKLNFKSSSCYSSSSFDYFMFKKRYLNYKICVIGGGPSGFYSTKYLLDNKNNINISIDMIDKLPIPFGLVRYGVAPDHPEVKSVIEQFIEVAKNDKFKFYGNIEVGKDITISELKKKYSAIIFSYGAEGNRNLNIPGENLNGVYSAREFVNWYNGHPDSINIENNLHLNQIKNVVIIGQGNVALDCARILSKDYTELEPTDITTNSINKLKQSNIKHITLVGRRGYGQIACTIKELRELTKLNSTNIFLNLNNNELEKHLTESTKKEIEEKRPLKRMIDLLNEIKENTNKKLQSNDIIIHSETNLLHNNDNNDNNNNNNNRIIELKFLLKPKEIKGINNQIKEVVFEKCELIGPPNNQTTKSTGELVTIPCDLLLSSIGYKTLQISNEIPFNHQTYTIPHQNGRIINEQDDGNRNNNNNNNNIIKGLYVTGWCKRGPTGIIGTNINDSKETVASIISDIQNNILEPISNDNDDDNNKLSNIKSDIVTWENVLKLDEYEKLIGSKKNPPKIREKCISVYDMLENMK